MPVRCHMPHDVALTHGAAHHVVGATPPNRKPPPMSSGVAAAITRNIEWARRRICQETAILVCFKTERLGKSRGPTAGTIDCGARADTRTSGQCMATCDKSPIHVHPSHATQAASRRHVSMVPGPPPLRAKLEVHTAFTCDVGNEGALALQAEPHSSTHHDHSR